MTSDKLEIIVLSEIEYNEIDDSDWNQYVDIETCDILDTYYNDDDNDDNDTQNKYIKKHMIFETIIMLYKVFKNTFV